MLLAVPNVSEGRDAAIVTAIGAAFATGAELLDTHSDADHNRTVFTLVGEARALAGGLLAGARKAVDEIDMGRYDGLHPAIGALDVCPVVWLADSDREAARRGALGVAERIATEIEIPVFLYGDLATSAERRERAFFRRGGLQELSRRLEEGELAPDLGPPRLHPTAGAILATTRPPLVAFNLELDRGGIAAARAVASGLREADGGLPGVRAIGLELSGGRPQVSVNVHDPNAVPLARLVSAARRLAAPHGAAPVAAELIGLAPAAALEGFPADLPLLGFDADRHLIERRLASLGKD